MAHSLTLPDKKGKVSQENPLPVEIVEGDDILDLIERFGISAIPIIMADYFDGYKISDKDDDASPNYYGFVKADGRWYIMRETVSAGNDTYRYAIGPSGYDTAWGNRASLTYDYYCNLFR